jgi:hypothetical protein
MVLFLSRLAVASLAILACRQAFAQIDPERRSLLQVGYNAALQGRQPFSAYAFFYHNHPDFPATNMTLRLAVAPTYLDSELGFRGALGPSTDLAIGLAGGGFADSYAEIRGGRYLKSESFIGHGGEIRGAVYHQFNPGYLIPLNAILRGTARFSTYGEDDTHPAFIIPEDRGTYSLRTGLRWGGREPTLFPQLAMALSIWYDGQYRTGTGLYGFNDREIERFSHTFWTESSLVYTFPKSQQTFEVSLSLGTSIHADRFSAYRLGALLPLISEFPLSLPGYYYQEISARNFVLFGANYLLPLDRKQRWNLNLTAATAGVDYIEGLQQEGHWHSGVGGGLLYRSKSWRVMGGYAYGVDAIRSSGRGAHSIGFLMQLDWGEAREALFSPTSPSLWRGVQRVFGLFGK